MNGDKLELIQSLGRDVTSIEQGSNQFSRKVLRELFELLESYSPMWYTKRHHSRAAAALGQCSPSRSAER